MINMHKTGKVLIDCSTTNSDLLYRVGVVIPDPFIYFQIDDTEAVIVRSLEYSRVKKFSKKNIQVFLPEEIVDSPDLALNNKNILKGLLKKYNVSCMKVPELFPVVYADSIRDVGVNVEIVEGSFFPEREVKNELELASIREAVKVVELCMLHAENIIKESSVDDDNILKWNGNILTSEILHKEINLQAVKYDAVALDTIVASGVDSSQPHNVGAGPIKSGTPIVVDIFPRMNKTGYWGDMTRTFVKGKAPDIVKRAYEAVKEAKSRSKEMIKVGEKPATVHNLALEILNNAGFPTGKKDGEFYGFFHSLGHGVGLDIHESPLVGARTLKPFAKNSVITVEPGVYYKEWGGIRLEDMVIVKENGVECITDYPEKLEI
jgi:Xaa-Pro aminopeptidase